MNIQNLEANATLDAEATADITGGGSWTLRRIVYRKNQIRKVFTKMKCGVKYRAVMIFNYCGQHKKTVYSVA